MEQGRKRSQNCPEGMQKQNRVWKAQCRARPAVCLGSLILLRKALLRVNAIKRRKSFCACFVCSLSCPELLLEDASALHKFRVQLCGLK